MNHPRNNLFIIAALCAVSCIPIGAFAAQSGGGYIVYDQINGAPLVNSGSGFANQSGSSPISLPGMQGGGFVTFGGAFRSSGQAPAAPTPPAPTPTPTPSGGGGTLLNIINSTTAGTNNPVTGFPATGPVLNPIPNPNTPVAVGNPITNPLQATGSGNPIAVVPPGGIAPAITPGEKPALFDVSAEPIEMPGQQTVISLVEGAIFIVLGLLLAWVLFYKVQRGLRRRKINQLMK